MPIGQRIQEARKKAGYTQKELAEKIGVVTGTIQQYELGKRQPRIEQIQAIAAALGCDPYSLYSWDQATAALEERINARDRINAALGRLNDVGMGKAAAAVEVIAEVPRYRAETAPQSPPSSEDTDTTSSPDAPEGTEPGK